jgi:hypothetical protein
MIPPVDSNRQQQADELCALQAIYGEDAVQLLDAGSLRFAIPDAASAPHLQLTVHLPESYPAEHPPVLQLSDSCNCLSEDVLSGLARDLESSFKAGEVVLWQWIEHLREQWPTIDPQQLTSDATAAVVEAAAADTDSLLAAELQVAELEDRGRGGDQQKQQQQQQATRTGQDDELQAALAEVVAAVVHGEPFTEKRSTFQVLTFCIGPRCLAGWCPVKALHTIGHKTGRAGCLRPWCRHIWLQPPAWCTLRR